MARNVPPKLPADNPYIVSPLAQPVAVYEDVPEGEERAPNVIYIKPRMNAADADRIDPKNQIVSSLEVNIVKWSGPHLDQLPLERQTFEALDVTTHPHLQKVLEEIGERNKRAESPNPN